MAGASADDSTDEAVISVVTYLWRGNRSFLPGYVNALARMVGRYLPVPHRFICITDYPNEGFSAEVEYMAMPAAARTAGKTVTPEKEHFPSSYPRLWTFSEEARVLGERVLVLDIDCVIVNDMTPLFRLDHDFVGWNVRPPKGCPPRLGGGTWMLRTGTRQAVWQRFMDNPQAAINAARGAGYRGSDQAWMSYCLKDEPRWPEPSGIYCAQDFLKPSQTAVRRPLFSKLGRRLRGQYRMVYPVLKVPKHAILLHYNGSDDRKPWTSNDVIVREHWQPFFEAA